MSKVFEVLADSNRTKITSDYRFSHKKNGVYVFLNEDNQPEIFANKGNT